MNLTDTPGTRKMRKYEKELIILCKIMILTGTSLLGYSLINSYIGFIIGFIIGLIYILIS